VWALTANNATYTADTARRVLPIPLEVRGSSPETAGGWRFDPVERALSDVQTYYRAALGMLSAHLSASEPVQLAPWGSYDSWSAIVRGALVRAGLPDPIALREQVGEVDQDAITFAALFSVCTQMHAVGDSFAAGDVYDWFALHPDMLIGREKAWDAAKARHVFDLIDVDLGGRHADRVRFGKLVTRYARRRTDRGQYWERRGRKSRSGAAVWQVIGPTLA
jgi:hypothetical protein